jgi:hypothetical protein
MNQFERFVYDLVKANPKIKTAIRNVYQSIFDMLPRRKEYAVTPIEYKEGYFFGFHELQPFSKDNDKVLANKLPYSDIRMPLKEDYLSVGFFDFDGKALGAYTKLGETNTWNFQKGCRLQWINSDKIIFNCTLKGKMVSKIIDIHSRKEKVIPYPIDTVSPDGSYATSFSYQRLEEHMPGYGYCHPDDYASIDEKAPSDTGFYLINLDTGERTLLADLKSLAKRTKREEASIRSDHYVTHSEFSHDSKYVSFFHRWTGEDKSKRYTKLMIYNLDTDELFGIPAAGYMTSHYDWNNKHEIIAHCNFENLDSHVLLKIDDLDESHSVAHPALNSDGHQNFIDDKSFVTDTYPDKWRMSKLYAVDIPTNNVNLIASVHSPKTFQSDPSKGHIACDLHPIVSRDGKYVCFDTVRTGKRALAIMALQ